MNNKNIVVFGGGTGMSYLLKGLKEYPLNITSVVSVCDDGGSTGILRDEFNMLAVGDIRQVLVSLSNGEKEFDNLMNYRFDSKGTLKNHAVGNILLTAATNVTGSVSKGIEILSKILNLKGKVMPFTEDNITLMAKMDDGSIVKGEHYITESPKNIEKVYYEKEPAINKELIDTIKNADIIVLSMGSLFTSLIPTLLSEKIRTAFDSSKAKIIYSCNLFTQPGETEGFSVSDHIKEINKYLGERKVDYVIASNTPIDKKLALKYQNEEQKDLVILDRENLDKLNVKLIEDNLAILDKKTYKHNSIKLGYLIFSLLFKEEENDK